MGTTSESTSTEHPAPLCYAPAWRGEAPGVDDDATQLEDTLMVTCPACGEPTAVWVAGEETHIAADCDVCCRPLHVVGRFRGGRFVAEQVEAGW